MQLYFVRHAQSTNNHLYSINHSDEGRVEDPELTGLGLRQADAVAGFLARSNPGDAVNGRDPTNHAGFHLTHLYTSLMIRAVQTSTAISKKINLPLTGWMDIHECGGIYLDDATSGTKVGQPGKKRSDFARLFPHLILPDEVQETGWWNRPHEEHEEFFPRARRVLEQLLRLHGGSDDRVCLVSHGGFYESMMYTICGNPQYGGVGFHINNTGISRIDFNEYGAQIIYLNRLEHLSWDLIS